MGDLWRTLLLLAAALCAAPAAAQNRDFCADRPGMGTPACTLEKGQAMLEVTAFGFDHTADPTAYNDSFTLADTLVRYGLSDTTELQVGVTGFVHAIATDRMTRAKDKADGLGDSYLAIRHGFAGSSSVAAVEVYVTLPTGSGPAGAGTWGTGILVPINLDAPAGFILALTPEIDATPNASGSGRHLTFGSVLGLSHQLTSRMGGSLEISAVQDNDPDGHSFGSKLAGSVAYQASSRLQLNAEIDVGVIQSAPRTLAMVGFALRL